MNYRIHSHTYMSGGRFCRRRCLGQCSAKGQNQTFTELTHISAVIYCTDRILESVISNTRNGKSNSTFFI